MAQPPRTAIAGVFFTTAITLGRRSRFQVEATARLFIETLQHYRALGSYKLFAFVVMPDHVHLLIETENVSKAMKDIKGGFAHKMDETFWQRGFTDHLIRDREDFDNHVNYIHKNPVKDRLCVLPEEWPYSSAFRG